LAIGVDLLSDSTHWNPGSIIHPKLNSALQLFSSTAIRVQQVCLVDDFVVAVPTEKPGVCDVLQRVRTIATLQENLNNGRGYLS
jgi:hypothetical protein